MSAPVEAPRGSGLAGAATLLAASVALSRLLGYAREAVLAYQVGAGASTDAYYAAFQLPDLLGYLLAGGALSIAFLPLYTRLRSGGDPEEAERLLATVLGTLGALAVFATAALWLAAGPLVRLQFPRFDPATQALTVRLTRIVLPAQIFFLTGGILQAALFARGRFLAAALAPLGYNGAIIAGGLLLAPRIGVEGFSWGALAGAALGPLLAPWLDARGRVPLRLRVAPLDRRFLRYLALAAPLMLGQTLLTVDEWYGRWFGGLLGAGAVAQLGYARRLMQVPVAVGGQALAAAALPLLARLWAEGRRAELDRVVTATLRTGLGLGVLAGGAVWVLARPLVVFVYQHGRFGPSDSESVSALLALFALAVPAWIVQQIGARAFYARGDTWRPMLLGTAIALAAIPLYLALGRRFGVAGLAAAGAIGMSANALATLVLARRLHGAPPFGLLAASGARALAIAVLAAAAARVVLGGLPTPPHGPKEAILALAAGGATYGAVAAIAIPLFGDAALRGAARSFVRRAFGRWRPA